MLSLTSQRSLVPQLGLVVPCSLPDRHRAGLRVAMPCAALDTSLNWGPGCNA